MLSCFSLAALRPCRSGRFLRTSARAWANVLKVRPLARPAATAQQSLSLPTTNKRARKASRHTRIMCG
eukprot:303294-Pleurochrysis_carterae.AAC.1